VLWEAQEQEPKPHLKEEVEEQSESLYLTLAIVDKLSGAGGATISNQPVLALEEAQTVMYQKEI